MKEIKFRDYNPETKEMRYFDLDDYDKEEHNAWGNIMQYTGLKDRNGVDVYEGDVLNCGNYTDNSKPCNCIVVWDNELAKFVEKEIRGGKKLSTVDNKVGKVIGNIYENSELINSKHLDEPYKCQSYYDGELKNCTCGECDKIIK